MRVQSVGVVGAGTMGAALAELFAFNGLRVVLRDVDEPLVARGLERVQQLADEVVGYHRQRADREIERIERLGVTLTDEQRSTVRTRLAPKFTDDDAAELRSRVHGTTRLEEVAAADLVVEAVPERLEIKRAVWEELDRLAPAESILASNTSSLPLSRIVRGFRHAPSSLVTHFFNPPGTLPLVELAGGVETRDELVDEVAQWLGERRNHRGPLVPIRVKESPGFVVNRLLIPVLTEAGFALDEGLAGPREIDLAMKAGAGLPMGPFELADLIGLDVALEVAEILVRETGDPKYRPPHALRRLVDAGHLGRKTGRGFYEYP